jgi:hypothetical protein
MSFRQCLKPRTDVLKVINFAQDRLKRHGYTGLSEKPKMGELQMDWLRSEDLKEEKVVTTPAATVSRQKVVGLLQIDPRIGYSDPSPKS